MIRSIVQSAMWTNHQWELAGEAEGKGETHSSSENSNFNETWIVRSRFRVDLAHIVSEDVCYVSRVRRLDDELQVDHTAAS